ncbi:hypothetical protein LJB42_002979 [Komagataella kurtzmanii]|nr:hypothetical protein LJB42_002979 [Komagataella kurtzmanii]
MILSRLSRISGLHFRQQYVLSLSQRSAPIRQVCGTRVRSATASDETLVARELETPSTVRLRPYQKDCIESIMKVIRGGETRLAVSLATGGGKTVIFSNLLNEIPSNKYNGQKTLILVHRKELADQAARTIKRFFPHMKVEIDMAGLRPTHDDDVDVVVASVPTLARNNSKNPRLFDYDPTEFKAIIIDECHHAISDSYIKILQYFNALSKDSSDRIIVVGFSATLKRHDAQPLDKVFNTIAYEKDLISMVKEGYLSELSITKVEGAFSLDDVKMDKTGDYQLQSLESSVNTAAVAELVLKTYLERKKMLGLKSSLFFCVNKQHVQDLCELFCANGIKAGFVSGNTSLLEREQIIKKFIDGKLNVLMNCNVFTEGTDIPNIDSIFLLRPTKSRPLLSQMIGRGLRLHSGKTKCYVTDFVGTTHCGINVDATLEGITKRQMNSLLQFDQEMVHGNRDYSKILEEVPDYLRYTSFNDITSYINSIPKNLSKENQRSIEYKLYKQHSLPWIQLGIDSWGVSLADRSYLRIDKTKGKFELKRYIAVPYPKNGIKRKKLIFHSGNLEEILTDAERFLKEKGSKPLFLGSYPISNKQYEYLCKEFINVAQGSSGIQMEYFVPFLKRYLRKLTKHQASVLIFAKMAGGAFALQRYIKYKMLSTKNIQDEKVPILKEEVMDKLAQKIKDNK